jgi:oligopeptide/dipeptide ABC transporter ATP-binding protein
MVDLQRDSGLAYLFIAHDLAVIGQVSDRVAVMYLGQIVETASRDEIFSRPLHPYTRALLAAVTMPDPHNRRPKTVLTGEVPSPVNPPSGCHFHTRCSRAMAKCRVETPVMCSPVERHVVYCHLYD